MRRETTSILERKRNGGMHRQKAYRQIKAMLVGHGFISPRLYHLVLMDDAAESEAPARRFQVVLKALCRKLTSVGIPSRWRACLERDADKGVHFHVFLLVDGNSPRNPDEFINTKDGPQAWLRPMLERRHMTFFLSQPKADMHRKGGTVHGRRLNYATLAGAKMADCLEWISYLVKKRSKPDDLRTIYFSSRDGRAAQPAFAVQATPALEEYAGDVGELAALELY